MFLAIVLAAFAAITPAQSRSADELARAYFTEACSDSNERYGVVTVDDNVLHELTLDPRPLAVTIDDAAFKPLCERPMIAYHCHPSSDRLSRFPGIGEDGRSSDFGTVAFLEYLCAEQTPLPVVIEHRIVHTGGDGAIIEFGLRGVPLERARGLGRQMAELMAKAEPTVSAYGIQDWSIISSLPARMKGVMEGLQDLYGSLRTSYQEELFQFIRRTCPGVETAEQFERCESFTLEAFLERRDACDDRIITLVEKPELSACVPSTGARIELGGPRYPGWKEVTTETYDAFTAAGHCVIAFCSDTRGFDAARPCTIVLEELGHELPDCAQLKRGFVDVARNGSLVARHDAAWTESILIEDGRRFLINVPRLSDQMFAAILCGPEIFFGANPSN